MGLSRPTVQILYARARRKIARFLAEGGEIGPSPGGDYRVCETAARIAIVAASAENRTITIRQTNKRDSAKATANAISA